MDDRKLRQVALAHINFFLDWGHTPQTLAQALQIEPQNIVLSYENFLLRILASANPSARCND